MSEASLSCDRFEFISVLYYFCIHFSHYINKKILTLYLPRANSVHEAYFIWDLKRRMIVQRPPIKQVLYYHMYIYCNADVMWIAAQRIPGIRDGVISMYSNDLDIDNRRRFHFNATCIRGTNHKNYNFLDFDWFKKLLFSSCEVVIGQFVIRRTVK